jgi:hypothetical protein
MLDDFQDNYRDSLNCSITCKRTLSYRIQNSPMRSDPKGEGPGTPEQIGMRFIVICTRRNH